MAEQRRGELGRAHRRWTSNSARANREWWDAYDWGAGGEEWTASAQWKQALVDDVLLAAIPAGVAVLEIGPGAGRWSEVLAARASRLVLVDLSATALERCRERLAGLGQVTFVRCAGSELPGVADDSIDAVWSFDVFVHIAPLDVVGYLDEIARDGAP